MLQPPGSSRGSREYASNRKKTQEVTPEENLRQLQRSAPNKKCADCGSKLPQCVNLTVGTFICISCAGIHRELNNRVKGIGHSSFSHEEVDKLKTSDNEKVNSLWLANYNPQNERMKPPDGNQNQDQLRAWIRRKYHDKAWCGGNGSVSVSSPPPKQPAGRGPGRGPPPQKSGKSPPPKRGSRQPQPTVVQIPPANQPPPQEDLLGFGGQSPVPAAPLATGTNNDGWDAFGGSKQQNQAPANDPFAQTPAPQATQQNFANFGSPQDSSQLHQQDPFGTPAQQAGQINFASFSASNVQPPQQQAPQQLDQSHQYGNFANFGSPQAPAPGQPMNMGEMLPSQQVQNGFASFPAAGAPADPQQPPQQSNGQPQPFGNFGNFNNNDQMQEQTNFSPQMPQPQLSVPGQVQKMSQMGGMPAQQQQNVFPPGQQHNMEATQINNGMMSGFDAFDQLQEHQQPLPQQQQQMQPRQQGQAQLQMQYQGGPPQPQQHNPQQSQQLGNFDQQVPQPPTPAPDQGQDFSQMGGAQAQPQTHAFPERGQQQNLQASQMHVMQSGFGSFDANQHQQPSMQLPQGGLTMQPTDNAAPGLTDLSVMSAPAPQEENPMDAFAHLSVSKDGTESAPAPAIVATSVAPTQTKAEDNQRTSKFATDQIVCYKSNGDRKKAKVVKVHLDDALEPFYTIKLDFGKEKQTDDAHLEELNPLYERLESVMLSLSFDQLSKVEQLVAQLAPSNPNELSVTGAPKSTAPSSMRTDQPVGSFGISSAQASAGVPMSVPASPGGMSHVSQLTQPTTGQLPQIPSAQPSTGVGFSNGGGGGLSTIPSPGSFQGSEMMTQSTSNMNMGTLPPPPMVPHLQSQPLQQQMQIQPPQGQGMQPQYMGQGQPHGGMPNAAQPGAQQYTGQGIQPQIQVSHNTMMMHQQQQGMPYQQQMNEQMPQQMLQPQQMNQHIPQQVHQQMMNQQSQQPQVSMVPQPGTMNGQQQESSAQFGQNAQMMGQQLVYGQQNQTNQMGQIPQGTQAPIPQAPMSPQGNPFDMY